MNNYSSLISIFRVLYIIVNNIHFTFQIFSHPFGEVWKLNASPHDSQLLSTCYSSVKGSSITMETALLRLPVDSSLESSGQEFLTFKETEVLKTQEHGTEIKTTEFHPTDSNLLACVVDGKILIFNRSEAETRCVVAAEVSSKSSSKFVGGKWSQHNQFNQFIALYECSVK
jgi:EARP and GARP complex-interacting protein 1